VAYRLLHNDSFPSWNYSIKNGATTIWEGWDSWTPENGFGDANMNSSNHFSLGAVYQWMVENIGGIRKEGVAYKHLVIAPVPGGRLTSARVSYDSINGMGETEWKQNGDRIEMTIQIPANTTGTVILPSVSVDTLTESGKPLREADGLTFERQEPGQVFINAGSGIYHFQIQNPVIASDPQEITRSSAG
jgi:alpha-L-rhamnosidase